LIFGANADSSFADIDCSVVDATRPPYVCGFMVLPKFGSEDLTPLLQAAKQRPLNTVPGVVAPQALMLSLNQLERMLAFTDVFLPKHDETYAMTGLKDPADQANFFSASTRTAR
jgi:hypothetical protein